MKEKLEQILTQAHPVIPVMVIHHIEQALPMARALRDGGITVFEITLRTDCALKAIALLNREMPDCSVGAGTVINREQFLQVIDAGGDYIVSPGITDELLSVAKQTRLPFLPGVSTASEVMHAFSHGFDTLKFFPAEKSGGTGMLKAFSGPFGQVRFAPQAALTRIMPRVILSAPMLPVWEGHGCCRTVLLKMKTGKQ